MVLEDERPPPPDGGHAATRCARLLQRVTWRAHGEFILVLTPLFTTRMEILGEPRSTRNSGLRFSQISRVHKGVHSHITSKFGALILIPLTKCINEGPQWQSHFLNQHQILQYPCFNHHTQTEQTQRAAQLVAQPMPAPNKFQKYRYALKCFRVDC
eukprot:SAG31_NODE_6738_length_1904_cov_8.431579_1_plen_156_part_00